MAGGTVAYDRLQLQLGLGVYGALDRFVAPGDLVLLSVASESRLFAPLQWFGREVTGDLAFDLGRFALQGLPPLDDPVVSNADLETLLDWLEGRSHVATESAPVAPQEETRDRALMANLATIARELGSAEHPVQRSRQDAGAGWFGSQGRAALRA